MQATDHIPSNGSSTSSSLLRRVIARDSIAWDRFAKLYGPLVYRWARQANLQNEDAADIAQEVFRGVVNNLGGFEPGSGNTFRGWLFGVTRNKIADHFRKFGKESPAIGGTDAGLMLDNVVPHNADSLEPTSDRIDDQLDLLHRALRLIKVEFTDTTWSAFWRSTVDGVPHRRNC